MIKWCVENKIIVAMFTAVILLGGVFSYIHLERQENPAITAPMAVVQCIYPGSSPEDVEKQIIKPIEDEIMGMNEIKNVESFALDSVGIVKVTFKDMSDDDLVKAGDDVRTKVEDIEGELPESAYKPTVDTDLADCFGVVLGLYSDDYVNADFKEVAENLEDRLSKIEGVSDVEISGDVGEEITVNLDMIKLKQYGISPADIGTLITARNVSIPGGKIDLSDSKVPIQISGEYESLEEIKGTIVGVSEETGLPVYLRDVAEIHLGDETAEKVARINNKNGVLIGIEYAEGQNVLKIEKKILKELEEFKNDTLYAGMDLVILTDQAQFVRESLMLFIENLISAIVLVVVVVYITMGLRSAIVVSVPIAIVISGIMIYMKMTGIPMHQVSIASLVISLSLLVANGIVANDNMYLYMERGMDRLTACVQGTRDVSIPILTSTLTTIASFLPLAMMQGSAGKFASSLPVLVSVALISSCVLSITAVPAMGHKILRVENKSSDSALGRFWNKSKGKLPQELQGISLNKLNNVYEETLVKALEAPKKTIRIFVVIFVAAMMIALTLEIQVFPPIEREQYVLDVNLPQGSTLENTKEAAAEAGGILESSKDVNSFAAQIGDGFMKYYVTFQESRQGSNISEFLVNGKRSEAENVAREIQRQIPNADVNVKFLEINLPQDYPIQIRISGKNIEELQKTAEDIQEKISGAEGIWSTEINYGKPGYKLTVDVNEEKANLVGVTNYEIASIVRMSVNGVEITQLKQEDMDKDSVPVVMTAGNGEKDNINVLNEIFINSSVTGENIPLSQIAELKTEKSINQIVRRDGVRTVTVGVFLNSDAGSSKVLRECKKILKDYELPAGCSIEYGGNNEFTEETFSTMVLPAFIAVILIYMILAIQFKSLTEPMIIMGTIPLSFIGVILGLRIMGYPIGFMAMLGAISLMGVVVNNGIVLLDYIKLIDSDGSEGETPCDMKNVIVKACRTRIRPIMIGMITTVLSMLPLMISGGPLWAPLAAAIVFGMLISSILTMLVIPCAYLILKEHKNISKI
ncbi:MAG: efflux RND transporter permease subunit [Anaerovoracaceae bacterium]